MRALSPAAVAVLAGPDAAIVQLVNLNFSPTPIALNSSNWNLDYAGVTYQGAYGLGSVSAITDRPGEVQGISMELAGGDSARIALALDDADIIQGTPLVIRTAILSTANYQIVDAPIDFVGTLDTMGIAEDGTQCSVRVTAESRAVDLLRGVPQFYNDTDQRLINPLDGSMKHVVDQIDKPVVWPSREALQR